MHYVLYSPFIFHSIFKLILSIWISNKISLSTLAHHFFGTFNLIISWRSLQKDAILQYIGEMLQNNGDKRDPTTAFEPSAQKVNSVLVWDKIMLYAQTTAEAHCLVYFNIILSCQKCFLEHEYFILQVLNKMIFRI